MIIIGERINSSRIPIKRALEKKDKDFIQKEAKAQVDAGSQFLDVNCGLSGDTEVRDMEWLVKTIREVVDTPLCIDSPNPDVIRIGVVTCKDKALINSITCDESMYVKIIPLSLKYDCGIVCLTMDEKGMPDTASFRFKIAEKLYKILKSEGISDDNIYFDPLVRPVSSEPRQAEEVLKSIPMIKALGSVKVVCGISNVSYGLPKRGLVNSIFLSMALSVGMDGGLVDPLDRRIINTIKASEMILGKDRYCMNFIKRYREGLL